MSCDHNCAIRRKTYNSLLYFGCLCSILIRSMRFFFGKLSLLLSAYERSNKQNLEHDFASDKRGIRSRQFRCAKRESLKSIKEEKKYLEGTCNLFQLFFMQEIFKTVAIPTSQNLLFFLCTHIVMYLKRKEKNFMLANW